MALRARHVNVAFRDRVIYVDCGDSISAISSITVKFQKFSKKKFAYNLFLTFYYRIITLHSLI